MRKNEGKGATKLKKKHEGNIKTSQNIIEKGLKN